jgi:hypothetical protein
MTSRTRPLFLDTIEEEDIVLQATPNTPKAKNIALFGADENTENASSQGSAPLPIPVASRKKQLQATSPSTPVNVLHNIPSAAQRFSNRYDMSSPSSPASRFKSNPDWSLSSPSSPKNTLSPTIHPRASKENSLAQSIAFLKHKQQVIQTNEEHEYHKKKLERAKLLHYNLAKKLADEKKRQGLSSVPIPATAVATSEDEKISDMQRLEYLLLADMERMEEELKRLNKSCSK